MAVSKAYNVSNICLEIDGKQAGYLSSFTPPTYEVAQINQPLGTDGFTKRASGSPKIGEAAATFSIAQGDILMDWVASVLRKNSVEKNVAAIFADQNFAVKRRVDFPGSMITGVEFSALDAREGKKGFEVTVAFQPGGIKFSKESGKLSPVLGSKTKHWLVGNFQVKIPDLDERYITRLELPKITVKVAEDNPGTSRLPTRHYAAYEIAGLNVYHAAQAFDDVQGFVTKVLQDGVVSESEERTVTVEMLDPTMKQVMGTFTAKGCAPRKFTWSTALKPGQETMASSCIEFVVEDLAFERK